MRETEFVELNRTNLVNDVGLKFMDSIKPFIDCKLYDSKDMKKQISLYKVKYTVSMIYLLDSEVN